MTQENIDMEKVIEALQGTCKPLEYGIQAALGDDTEVDELTEEQLSHLDQEIFLCDTCGWWCEIAVSNDDNGDNVCDDCYEDEEEEEDEW